MMHLCKKAFGHVLGHDQDLRAFGHDAWALCLGTLLFQHLHFGQDAFGAWSKLGVLHFMSPSIHPLETVHSRWAHLKPCIPAGLTLWLRMCALKSF